MHYLVIYDISDNKQRLKTSKILADYGVRVQESVFELPGLDNEIWQKCLNRLKSKIKLSGDDSIRIYFICESCKKKISVLGKEIKPMDEPDVYII